MLEVRQTDEFKAWHKSLKDLAARARITVRIDRMSLGNFGDCCPVGDGVSELRIHTGAGYRVYFVRRGSEIVILLCGGDKHTQSQDIARAKKLAKEI